MASQQPVFLGDLQERNIPATFYIAITIEVIAVLVSMVVMAALLIPLLIQLKNGNFYQGSRVSSSSLRRRQTEAPYSTYNLYLVYLFLIDSIIFLPIIVAQFMALTQTSRRIFHSGIETFQSFYYFGDLVGEMKSVEGLVLFLYAVANLWMNAFIAYQVLILLKRSHRGERISQPSLTRVNIEGGGVILGTIAAGLLRHYMNSYQLVLLLLLTVIPFSYVIVLAISIHYRGYMPVANGSSPSGRAVRGLAFYFFRITIVFVVIWLPSITLGSYMLAIREAITLYIAAMTLMAIQPILSFCMILTKPDVRKYTEDFVTLTYLFENNDTNYCRKVQFWCRRKNDEIVNEDINEVARRAPPNSVVTILGFEVSQDIPIFEVSKGSDDDASVGANVNVEQDVDVSDSLSFE